ncbi:MAG: tRNA dihydrouridine synthase DusB [Hyphomicrobiales bacterium]
MCIQIGGIEIADRVFLAPMSGVTDAPFRRLAGRFGAGLVVTEMIASADLVERRADVLRRARGRGMVSPFVVQLAGREARWMAAGAQLAEDLGADIVDINMGCPAKQVTGSLSGSALMRDLDHALELIEATVAAVSVPVTLKMRLGWDDSSKNAAALARRAEAAGIRMVTVHGRTRCQFFNGTADWRAIAEVKRAVSIPVIANGDVRSLTDVRAVLAQSGADGVMVGRGAYGHPWRPGVLAAQLNGKDRPMPGLAERWAVVREHYDTILTHYGVELGTRCARKHLCWYIEQVADCGVEFDAAETKGWRKRLCQQDDPAIVQRVIDAFYARAQEKAAA